MSSVGGAAGRAPMLWRAAMSEPRRSPRTHSRKELAPARPPILLGMVVTASAVVLFAVLSRLLN